VSASGQTLYANVFVIAVCALFLLGSVSCRRTRNALAGDGEDGRPLASVINVADAATTVQLIRGFYPADGNPWRWSRSTFAVVLRPPSGAAKDGARLEMKFSYPESVFHREGQMKLSAKVGRQELPAEVYSMPGEYTFTRDVSAATLSSDAVAIEFTSDKKLVMDDQRELALIPLSIGLVSKGLGSK